MTGAELLEIDRLRAAITQALGQLTYEGSPPGRAAAIITLREALRAQNATDKQEACRNCGGPCTPILICARSANEPANHRPWCQRLCHGVLGR